MNRSIRGLLLVALLVCSSMAFADDINPPSWRGQSGSTFAQWEFLTSDNTPSPDSETNPYGASSTTVWPGVGQSWWSTWGGKNGVWPLSGTIEVQIPNSPIPNPFKDIWVQLTWAQQAPGVFPIITEKNSGTVATEIAEVILGPTGEPYGDGNWYVTTYSIHLQPNPSNEIVKIDGAVMVDELVIDTICIPEPATMTLLALGGAALFLRRRKR